MSSSARSFGALARYLATGRSGDHPERVAWSTSRNLPTDDPGLAGKIMRATAAQNVRVQQPVYHLALSFDPNDAVDRVTMERVADRVLAALDLQRHQVLIVSHRDREHPHVHLLINRVHPDTGLVWNRWQDRAVVQQVLRDEERALGLRIVPGRLASVDPTTSKHVVAATRKTLDAKPEVPAPLGRSNPDASGERIRPSRVIEVAKHLQSYERVEELSHERYRIEVDATASRTRLAQLEYTAERASRVHGEFDRALAHVYREPRLARDGFMAAAGQHGIAEATHRMHERPEQFGALIGEKKTRTFGLTPATDDTRARAAAVFASRAGRDAWEIGEALAAEVSLARAGRAENDLSRAFTALYENPAGARAAFQQVVVEHGPAEAIRRIRESPHDLGPLRVARQDDAHRVSGLIETLAKPEFVIDPTRETPIGPGSATEASRELAMSRAAIEHVVHREVSVRRALANAPDRSDLERRIVSALERLSPAEFRRLQSMLTSPQLIIAARLKGAVRDALLGREDHPER